MNSCIGIGSLAIVIMVVFDCISKMYIRINSSISVLLYNVEQIRKLFNIIYADRKTYVLLHLLFFKNNHAERNLPYGQQC